MKDIESNYLNWDSKMITDFSPENISDMYNHGYVFTRIDKGIMHQTRSLRIDLSKFELSSENRRILKKNDSVGLNLITKEIPLNNYNFKLGKLAKDFYDTKFGQGIMSAQKIKELLTNSNKTNFNLLLEYTIKVDESRSTAIGYTICYSNKEMVHYSYPFYDLNSAQKDMGMLMMILAIEYAKKNNFKYLYLGSLQRPTDTYKLQFSGLQWFDGEKWENDVDIVKELLKI